MDMRNLARNVVQQTSLDSSSLGIEPDLRRYREIVRGKVRDDLQDYITSDEIIAQHGKDIVSVPIKEVSIPKYKFGSNEEGAGQGEEIQIKMRTVMVVVRQVIRQGNTSRRNLFM